MLLDLQSRDVRVCQLQQKLFILATSTFLLVPVPVVQVSVQVPVLCKYKYSYHAVGYPTIVLKYRSSTRTSTKCIKTAENNTALVTRVVTMVRIFLLDLSLLTFFQHEILG